MDKSKRMPMIAGNWKMNLTGAQSATLIGEMIEQQNSAPCEVVLCVPFTAIAPAKAAMGESALLLGAQNCHWAEKGAFTGEISADMLVELGVHYVIIGHSERRQYFGETDETVNKRMKAALNKGLKVIFCVGETLEQRDAGETTKVILSQVKAGLAEISAEQMAKIIVAYEPVWAIGTGKTATAEMAGEVCGFIRGALTGMYDMELAYKMQILYGGSMNGANAKELLAQYDIDGGLIGSASLKVQDFAAIIAATEN